MSVSIVGASPPGSSGEDAQRSPSVRVDAAAPRIESLTPLRFFAAVLIVLHHGREQFAIGQGVSFFFVLSGFILAYAYPRLEGHREVLTFLRARIARIWPAHGATLVLAFVRDGSLASRSRQGERPGLLGGSPTGSFAPGGACNLEIVESVNWMGQTVVPPSRLVRLTGWAANLSDGSLPAEIYIRLDPARRPGESFPTTIHAHCAATCR